MMREIFLEFLTPTKLSEYFFSPEANVLLRKKEDFSFHQAYLLRVFLEGHLSFIEQKKIEFSSDFSISEIKDILKDKLFYLYFKARMEIPVWTEFEFATQKKLWMIVLKKRIFFSMGLSDIFWSFFLIVWLEKQKKKGKRDFICTRRCSLKNKRECISLFYNNLILEKRYLKSLVCTIYGAASRCASL